MDTRCHQPQGLFVLLLVFLLDCLFVTATDGGATPLESPELTYHEELRAYHEDEGASIRKEPDLIVLGFVTPWNGKGKEVALSQASLGRLDATSPVTWQFHPSGLAGGQDFDDAFYESLSKAGSRIYPRVLFEKWTLEDYKQLRDDPEPVVRRIVQMCEEGTYEGVVLEIWQSMLGVGALQGDHKVSFIKLIKDIGEGVRKESGLHTVLVLPPYTAGAGGMGAQDFEQLDMGFNHFVLMTYDFSSPGSQPGPMAPTFWVQAVASFFAKDCGLGEKVLVGLNFYGLDFSLSSASEKSGDKHVLGHEYIALLEEHKPEMQWVDRFGEHMFGYGNNGEQRAVFYPTRQSVGKRVAIAKEVGCGGVAIWELGQGLDHLFEVF